MTEKRKQIAVVAAGVIVAISSYSVYQIVTVVDELRHVEAALERDMLEHAAVLDRGGASDTVKAIVRDCPAEDRREFDRLLGQLDNLTANQLRTIEALFGECGDYFAMTRVVMANELQHMYRLYEHNQTFLSHIPLVFGERARLDSWEALINLEQERSELSMRLVQLQKNIITTLAAGATPEDEAIVVLLNEVAEVRENVSFIGMQIDSIRNDQLTS